MMNFISKAASILRSAIDLKAALHLVPLKEMYTSMQRHLDLKNVNLFGSESQNQGYKVFSPFSC